jgi:hypothetical protein
VKRKIIFILKKEMQNIADESMFYQERPKKLTGIVKSFSAFFNFIA